jgi:ribosome-binding ATPase YchF (GTP1/OBG family)
MLVRLGLAVAVAFSILVPQLARAGCADEVSKLMSKDTEKLTTRYNKVAKQAQEHASPKVIQEECRIARQLKPKLEDQLAALKQSGCVRDPQMGNMVADIVRGHEDDLAAANKTTARSECR